MSVVALCCVGPHHKSPVAVLAVLVIIMAAELLAGPDELDPNKHATPSEAGIFSFDLAQLAVCRCVSSRSVGSLRTL